MPTVRQSDVDPATWAKILAAAGPLPVPPPRSARTPAALRLVAPAYCPPGTWRFPLVTRCEVNERLWRDRNARTHAARRAVSRVLSCHLRELAPYADHVHAGKPLLAVFTRLGGRKVDRSNLPSALKACEDAVCLFLGVDDGDALWCPQFEQHPGHPDGCGVRLDLCLSGGPT